AYAGSDAVLPLIASEPERNLANTTVLQGVAEAAEDPNESGWRCLVTGDCVQCLVTGDCVQCLVPGDCVQCLATVSSAWSLCLVTGDCVQCLVPGDCVQCLVTGDCVQCLVTGDC
ncbi:hypothetical protein FOZ63_000095, partial [Perkinsus olseni]